MHQISLSLPAVVALIFAGHVGGFEVLSTPNDAAGRLGNGSLYFNCTSILSGGNQAAQWALQQVGGDVDITLYSGTTSSAILTNGDYTADEYHSLTAHNLTFDMAGTYKCKVSNFLKPDEDVHYNIYGLVLDELQCPANVTYYDGEEVTLNCSVRMAGLLRPDINLMLNNTLLNATKLSSLDMTSAEGSDVIYSYTFNVSLEDDGSAFTCSLGFSTSSPTSQAPPSYTDSCVTIISVDRTYAVRDVEVSLSSMNDSILQVGDVINCTARGNPEPEITWSKISGGAAEAEVVGHELVVTERMIGRNEYNCTAKNTIAAMDYMETVHLVFEAEAAESSSATSTISWVLLTAALITSVARLS